MIIAEFKNQEHGIKSVVEQISASRFKVSLIDEDSGNKVPIFRFYDNAEKATRYAKSLCGSGSSQADHKKLNGWDGYGEKGQAIYDQIFEQEKAEGEKQDRESGWYEPGGMYYGID